MSLWKRDQPKPRKTPMIHNSPSTLLLYLFFCNSFLAAALPKATPGAVIHRDIASAADPSAIIETVIVSSKPYTVTYSPSTLTQPATITGVGTTATVNAGAIVGALAGGAAIAALPFVIPKIIPEPVGGDGPISISLFTVDCSTRTAKKCSETCASDWFVSANSWHPTSTCQNPSCEKTVGCEASDSTKTVTSTPPPIATVFETASYDLPDMTEPDLQVVLDLQKGLDAAFTSLGVANTAFPPVPTPSCSQSGGSVDTYEFEVSNGPGLQLESVHSVPFELTRVG